MRILVKLLVLSALYYGLVTGAVAMQSQESHLVYANSLGASNHFKYFVAVNSDGTYLASRDVNDSTIIIWNLKTNKRQSIFHVDHSLVFDVAFQPMTDVLAVADNSGIVSLWHATNGKPIRKLAGHLGAVYCVRFSDDGKILAGAGEDHSVILWSMETRRVLHKFQGHKSPVWSLCFRPHSPYLYSGGEDGKIAQWNIKTYLLTAWFTGHGSTVRSLTCNSIGDKMASCGDDQKVIIWDTRQNKQIYLLPYSNIVWSSDFLADNKNLVVGSEDKTIQVWDTDSGHSIEIGKMSEAILYVKTLTNGNVVFATRTNIRH